MIIHGDEPLQVGALCRWNVWDQFGVPHDMRFVVERVASVDELVAQWHELGATEPMDIKPYIYKVATD